LAANISETDRAIDKRKAALFGELVHQRKNAFDLWPTTLKFSGFLAVVNVHAKLHQAKCSGSWVIVGTEKTKFCRKQYCPSLPRPVISWCVFM